jgi:hypothetical protein
MDAADKDLSSIINFDRYIYATCLAMSAFFGTSAGMLLAYFLVQGPPLDATLNQSLPPYMISMIWVLVEVLRNHGEIRWKVCLWTMLLSIIPAVIVHSTFRFFLS